jgi:hypothetical protein
MATDCICSPSTYGVISAEGTILLHTVLLRKWIARAYRTTQEGVAALEQQSLSIIRCTSRPPLETN